MVYDLKERRFARGGSTISMQLVKNVFLNRRKNIARKLEEALIVWLIEQNRLTSKERMFEVYLNIAEWGPGVYGLLEASEFYFGKRPSQLTLEECIYLASIIPKPKHYRSSFEANGRVERKSGGTLPAGSPQNGGQGSNFGSSCRRSRLVACGVDRRSWKMFR